MTTSLVKTIGTSGRDFTTFKTFASWLITQDLVAQDVMLYVYVYNNQAAGDITGAELVPKNHSAQNYCIIQPAPGLGVNELSPSGAMDYGTAGIELNIVNGSYQGLYHRPGVSLRGFRIKVATTAASDTSNVSGIYMGRNSSYPNNRLPEIKYCRFSITSTGALARVLGSGESAVGGIATDNLFIHESGNSLTCALNYGTQFERNTIVRLGTAKGFPGTSGIDSTLRDNIYIGCGSTPALGLPSSANAKITNNYTDTPMTGNTTGFTTMAEGTVLMAVPGDYRLKDNSPIAGAASTGGVKMFDMLHTYRGLTPDPGAFQLVAQPLPATPVGTITSQTITDQTIVFSGTIQNEVQSGTASIYKGGVQVGTSLGVTITGSTFTVKFAFIPGGNYDAPVITFTNDGGTGAPAGGAAPFTIANPVLPTAALTKQYLVGNKITLVGTVAGAPQSGSVSIPVAATPNGAVAQGPTPITIDGTGKFVVSFKDLPYGNYGAPVVTFTNGAGAGPAATGAAAFTVAPVNVPAEPGVNIQLIGAGQTFPTLKDFATWLNSRDLIANNEIIKAYVINDQVLDSGSSAGNYWTAPNGADSSHYCVICPAPGMSVNEIHKNDPLDYGVAGIEIALTTNSYLTIGDGVVVEGFRIYAHDIGTGTVNRSSIEIFNGGRATKAGPGVLRRNRIRAELADASNSVVYTGQSATPGQITDNYFESNTGSAPAISFSYGNIERNTIVRRGAAVGKQAILYRGGYESYVRDNIMLGGGPVPIKPTNGMGGMTLTSNLVDTALTTATAGITVVSGAALVADVNADYRPKAAGPAIGAASLAAVSTIDIVGQNRGPVPDIGAWQLNAFIPVPVASATQTIDGTTITITGTVTNGPTSGTASIQPATSNPDGASGVGPTDVTIAGSTFMVKWDDLQPGNYAAPVITFTNSGGVGQPATGVEAFSIISIGGNPSTPDAPSGGGGAAPVVSITSGTLSSEDGKTLSLAGDINLQGDPTGSIKLYFDELPNGTTQGPLDVTVTGLTWTYTGGPSPALLNYRARVLADANGFPAIATQDFQTISATAAIQLPLK